MRPYQSNQEDEDPDIKKIKKVGALEISGPVGAWSPLSVLWWCLCHCVPELGTALVLLW